MMDIEELARAYVDLYQDAGLDGIADEMSIRKIDLANEHYAAFLAAKEIVSRTEHNHHRPGPKPHCPGCGTDGVWEPCQKCDGIPCVCGG